MEKLGSRRPKYLGYTVTACAPYPMYCEIDGVALRWTEPLSRRNHSPLRIPEERHLSTEGLPMVWIAHLLSRRRGLKGRLSAPQRISPPRQPIEAKRRRRPRQAAGEGRHRPHKPPPPARRQSSYPTPGWRPWPAPYPAASSASADPMNSFRTAAPPRPSPPTIPMGLARPATGEALGQAARALWWPNASIWSG